MEGLGFPKRGRRVRDSFSRREAPSPLAELDSRWVKEAVQRSWASLELAQVRLTWWISRPRPGPSGPQLARVAGGVRCLRGRTGPPALLAYMALFRYKCVID